MSLRRMLPAVLIASTLLIASCGDDDGEATGEPATDQAMTTQGATTESPDGTDAVDAPSRIVSLSPTATESLFAIGAGDQVVAVDDQSTYPPEAPVTELSGLAPNVEAIAGYEPDLVVVSNDIDGVVDSLGRLDIPVLVQPAAATLDDVYDQIEELGARTGNEESASEVVQDMKAEIADIISGVAPDGTQGRYYHELDQTLYSVTSTTFIGQLYSLLGLTSIADAADPDGAAGGYPQLSAEYVIEADPDFVFLADTKCCGQTPETVAARPGWAGLAAVTAGRVVPLDDDVASRWGPRVVELLRAVAEPVEQAAQTVGG